MPTGNQERLRRLGKQLKMQMSARRLVEGDMSTYHCIIGKCVVQFSHGTIYDRRDIKCRSNIGIRGFPPCKDQHAKLEVWQYNRV